MNVQKSRQWKLKEFVQVGPDSFDGGSGVPLQLLHFEAPEANEATQKASIWFLGGFQGVSKNDAHLINLIQKAVEKTTFEPSVGLYLTPVVNPSSLAKNPRQNLAGVDLSRCFEAESATPLPLEGRCLTRWAQSILPKVIVTFSNGPTPLIRHLSVPNDIAQRLAELAERDAYIFGTEPEDKNEDGTVIPREVVDSGFGAWCVAQGISWIDFRVDATKKSFNDVKDADWKPSFGPAIKWLVEGFRFDPPAAEPDYELPQVIPALEMPPEFANL